MPAKLDRQNSPPELDNSPVSVLPRRNLLTEELINGFI
jgi:hypothetical protein